jgi:hypothetical protein
VVDQEEEEEREGGRLIEVYLVRIAREAEELFQAQRLRLVLEVVVASLADLQFVHRQDEERVRLRGERIEESEQHREERRTPGTLTVDSNDSRIALSCPIVQQAFEFLSEQNSSWTMSCSTGCRSSQGWGRTVRLWDAAGGGRDGGMGGGGSRRRAESAKKVISKRLIVTLLPYARAWAPGFWWCWVCLRP